MLLCITIVVWGQSSLLCQYINKLLQNDENIYVKQSAKGDVSPFVQGAVENELTFFEELSKVKCDDLKSIYNSIALPEWKNGNISVKEEYRKNSELNSLDIIEKGFNNTMSTIFDSNITTIIVGIISDATVFLL